MTDMFSRTARRNMRGDRRAGIERRIASVAIILGMTLILVHDAFAQPERREFERWGQIGVGRLVTTMSNTNVIAAGRINYPELSRFPAFEFPYNPDPDGRHIYYGNMVSFHVGGLSLDRGPQWSQNDPDRHMVESGDQNHYRFYQGFHFEGFPDYINSSQTSPVAVSNDVSGWPEGGWPATYPTSDPFLQRYYPSYPTAFSRGLASPRSLLTDPTSGFPGAGPNRYSPPGLYEPGQVVADQESFTVSFSTNRQDDSQDGKLMIYTTTRGLSWQSELAEDILFWKFTVTNVGTEPIIDTYVGMKASLDFPWATYAAFNTYSRSESFALDPYMDDPETGNPLYIAYGWDGDGNVEGARRCVPFQQARLTDETPVDRVALAGVTFLQTPQDSLTGRDHGISTWKAFNYGVRAVPTGVGNTRNRFYRLNILNENSPADLNGDGRDNWTWENPYPCGMEEAYNYGDRSAMILNAGPFTLRPGETDTLVVATMMGFSRSELFANARMAHQIFSSGWIVPEAPLQPAVEIEENSGEVILQWGRISENDSLNALLGRQNFEGYKIYRSTDGGQTWGNRAITDADGNIVDYVPMAQYDLVNDIVGPSPVMPTFNRGSDTGFGAIYSPTNREVDVPIARLGQTVVDTLTYRFVDHDVVDGFSYRYAVVAYGPGDDEPDGLRPLQNSRTSGRNVITAVPHGPTAQSEADLGRVRVVPNPYVVSNPQETGVRERMVKFTNMPERAMVRIFNVAGEIVAMLEHDASTAPIGSELRWNLRSQENTEVAPGLYLYHVQSDLGIVTGKMVIIK
jgi:hypothetical protein